MKLQNLIHILIGIVCIGVFPNAQAVSPAPDGGYPGQNTAEGQNAFKNLTTGSGNTAVGWFSLKSLATGSFNTGVGAGTLALNTADNNTATGAAALILNTTGFDNTANGVAALLSNSTGAANTANGVQALFSNTRGFENTAVGWQALLNNTSGSGNTANGDQALFFVTGNSNYNSAFGYNAGHRVTTASGVTCIGANVGGANVNATTWIGGVYGVTTQSSTTAPVIVSDDGQLGTVVSSERFKKDIATMDTASEAILSLRPVTFHYKTDTTSTPQFGLIAEEVTKVNPALVLSDKEGKPYTVRYDQVNAMLLNEFLKEHQAFLKEQRKVEEQGRKARDQEGTIRQLKATVAKQEATIVQQQKAMEAVTGRLNEQETQIQKVSAQLDGSRSAPQTVVNNQ
jgi:uncharacterized coiled-coil protein SlyX